MSEGILSNSTTARINASPEKPMQNMTQQQQQQLLQHLARVESFNERSQMFQGIGSQLDAEGQRKQRTLSQEQHEHDNLNP